MRQPDGICDRCGFRVRLGRLSEESVMGHRTGIMVCEKCYDESHPQLDTRNVRTDDKQRVENSRSDYAELAASRALFGWNPVGNQASSTLTVEVGRVRVVIS